MKMFSECSGECCVCSSGGFCLAGHGDDDFHPTSKEKIIENLDEGKYPNYTEYMIKYLANQYGYVYDVKNAGKKKKEKQPTNKQPVKESFGGYTFEVVVAGNCVSCGKHIDDDNIFLCKDCQSKQNAEKLFEEEKMGKTGRAYKTPVWWKTYDYLSGHTYILGDKFKSKREAMVRAINDGMIVIPQSTVPITEDQKQIAELENYIKEKSYK